MRSVAKVLLLGAFSVLVVMASASVARADDDFAVFTLSTKTRIAQVTLEPGIYAFRATHARDGGEMVVRVTDVGDTTLYATVNARMQSDVSVASEHRLNFDPGDVGQLLSWEVKSKGYSLSFPK